MKKAQEALVFPCKGALEADIVSKLGFFAMLPGSDEAKVNRGLTSMARRIVM